MNQGIRPGTRLAWLLLIVVSLGAAVASAAEDTDFSGRWRAKLSSPQGDEIIVVMDLSQDVAGAWTGTMRSSQARDRSITLSNLVVGGGQVQFSIKLPEFPGVRQDYVGEISDDGQTLDGSLHVENPQGSFDMPLEFSKVATEAAAGPAPAEESPVARFDPSNPLTGRWTARPSDKEKERELHLELGLDSAGEWAGRLTDTGTDESNTLRDIEMGDNTVSFNFRPEGAPFLASFWGRYLPEEDEIRGSLSLGGRSQPLTFTRLGPAPGAQEDLFAEEKEPLPRKHFKPLGVVAHGSYWHPLYVIKEGVRNINDITTSSWAWDAGLRWYVLDTFAVGGRYVRGGVGFDTNAQNLALFDPTTNPPGPQSDGLRPPITKDAFIAMNGFEFTMAGYVGPVLFPNSKFNPYVTGLIGRMDWELNVDGRGSEVITLRDEPVQGTDWTFGGGLGTEYAISQRIGLEFEWTWAYTVTQDDQLWPDTTYQWTSQHVFRFSFGGIVWF